MLSTHLMKDLAGLHRAEQIKARQFDRVLRLRHAKQVAKRNLYRGIEQMLKAEGNRQTVLDVLDRFTTEDSVPRTSCRA